MNLYYLQCIMYILTSGEFESSVLTIPEPVPLIFTQYYRILWHEIKFLIKCTTYIHTHILQRYIRCICMLTTSEGFLVTYMYIHIYVTRRHEILSEGSLVKHAYVLYICCKYMCIYMLV